MKRREASAAILMTLLLGACASAKQTVQHVEGARPKQVCIAEHQAVRPEFLQALQEAYRKNGIETRVMDGTYELRDNRWYTKWKSQDARGCEALGFYVANWHWDVGNYMRFANIWMVTPDGKKRLGGASYQAGTGPDKFINARDKVFELVDQMLAP